jgi:hypothetical protein
MFVARLKFSIGIAALAATVGCGGERASVSGRVTLDGKPPANVTIYFQPERGPLAQAALDADGAYQLEVPGTGSSVAPGQYRIYLVATASEDEELAKSQLTEADYNAGKRPAKPRVQLPAGFEKYYSAMTTDLVRNVEPGSNEIDLDLKRN